MEYMMLIYETAMDFNARTNEQSETLMGGAVPLSQPYWAVRAHLLQRVGRTHDAFDRATGLAEDDAVRRCLLERRG